MKMRYCVLPLLIVVFGCASQGTTSYYSAEYYKDGSIKKEKRIQNESPDNPVSPASIKVSDKETSASTGNTQAVDMAMDTIATGSTWGGLILMFLGTLIVIGSGYFPMLKWNKGLIVIGIGAGLFWLPILIDRFTWVIPIGLLVTAFLLFGDEIQEWFGSYFND